ncbi:MAG: DedA family protein [Deltaproteobacteria bacterium]|nr:DedA family protein [Deltaproteobacteria bacterium]
MIDPTQYLPDQEGPLALLVLFASSTLEYLFPPFPGDTVTLFGAFLVAARGWSFWAVLAATTLGSGLGAMLDYGLGLAALQRTRQRSEPPAPGARRPFHLRHEAQLQWLAERFRRHGAWFIVINRFLPGIRAFFFIAAGMAGMRPAAVLFFSLLSALAWNLMLMMVGLALGASWPRLYALFLAYTHGIWLLLGVAALLLTAWALLRWQRRRRAGPGD